MADTDDDMYRIADQLMGDEYAAMLFPLPGDPIEEDEEALRDDIEKNSAFVM